MNLTLLGHGQELILVFGQGCAPGAQNRDLLGDDTEDSLDRFATSQQN